MTVTFPIVAPADGEVVSPEWTADITEAVNDHEDSLLQIAEVRDGAIASTTALLASAAYTSETEITAFRVTNQTVVNGGAYLFLGQTQFVPTATGCEWEIRLREDTTSGTIVGTTRLFSVNTAGFGYPLHWYFIWKCTVSSSTKTFVYTIQRNAGAGNVAINGQSGSGSTTHMSFLRMGVSGNVRSI